MKEIIFPYCTKQRAITNLSLGEKIGTISNLPLCISRIYYFFTAYDTARVLLLHILHVKYGILIITCVG